MNKAPLLASFLAGGAMALAGAWMIKPAVTVTVTTSTPSATPAPSSTSTPAPSATIAPSRTPAPSATPTAAPISAAGLGWQGEVQCYQCTPFTVRVLLSHYNPNEVYPDYPNLNCYRFSEDGSYCVSPTWIGVPWESVWGIGAACPPEWPVGSWLDVPGVGRWICFDHGGLIKCASDGLCKVDLLGPGGEAWDLREFNATLWVPQSYLIRLSEK